MFASATGTQSTLNYYDIGSATLQPIKDLTLGGNPIVVNAAGYSKTQNVFWAVRAFRNPPKPGIGPFPDEIVRVDSLGNVDTIGAPANLAALGYTDFLALAGTVQGDIMYAHTKFPPNHIFQIDVNPSSPTLGQIISDKALSRISPGNGDGMLNIGDWDFNDADGQLYGLELSGGKRIVVKVDPATGVVTNVSDQTANLPDSDNYGAVFMEDGPSNLYVAANNKGGMGQSQTFMLRLDLNPPYVQAFTTGTALRINDGADCLLATDFGDAPETFKTSTAAGGPAHVLSEVFNPSHRYFLGDRVDSDIDGFPVATADSDDTNVPALNDEDAVPAGTVLNTNAPSLTVKVTNNTGRAGLLAGWLDLNADGTFSPAERATIPSPATDGTATLTWPAQTPANNPAATLPEPAQARPVTGRQPAHAEPVNEGQAAHAEPLNDGQAGHAVPAAAGRQAQEVLARAGGTTLRLRLYSDPAADAQPTGWVDGGEMEDHLVTLTPLADPPGGQPPGGQPPGGQPPGGSPPGGQVPGGQSPGQVAPVLGSTSGGEPNPTGTGLPETGRPVTAGIASGLALIILGGLLLASTRIIRGRDWRRHQ